MKHLKYFESNRKPKIGNYVVCVDQTMSDNLLLEDEIYVVEDVKETGYGVQLSLIGIPYFWESDRFKLSTLKSYKEKQFKKDIEKYNL